MSTKRSITKICAVAFLISLVAPIVYAGEKLNKAFDPEMIGANVPYFEIISGPAKKTYSNSKTGKTNIYKIDGCEVAVDISNGTVQALGLEKVTPKCSFYLEKFLPNIGRGTLPSVDKMTFGQFDSVASDGQYGADCLSLCGNAADPVGYEVWQGSHADRFYELKLGVILIDAASDASDKWKEAMLKKESEDWLVAGNFVCNKKYNDVARRSFKDVRITSVKIGFGLVEPACKP